MSRILVLLLCSFVEFQSATVFQNGPGVVVRPERQLVEAEMQRVEAEVADVLASVREYPAQLHKCTATFIAADALLTTAKCLYCEHCHLFVHALSSHLTDEGQRIKGHSYNISETLIHPDYEADPENYNIGLIKLTTKVKQAVVFGLPKKLHVVPGQNVTTYTWQFTSNFQEYYLEKVTEKSISNEVCSLFFNRYIDHRHICSRGNKPVTLGPFDEGVPVVDNTSGKGVVIGFFQAGGRLGSTKHKIYRSVYPYVEWIEKVIKCGFCTSSADEITPSPVPSQTFFSTSPEIIFYDKSITATLSTSDSGLSSDLTKLGGPLQLSTSEGVTVSGQDATSAGSQENAEWSGDHHSRKA